VLRYSRANSELGARWDCGRGSPHCELAGWTFRQVEASFISRYRINFQDRHIVPLRIGRSDCSNSQVREVRKGRMSCCKPS